MDDAEGRLYQDLKWAGLQWDEGTQRNMKRFEDSRPLTDSPGPDIGGPYGPYKQVLVTCEII